MVGGGDEHDADCRTKDPSLQLALPTCCRLRGSVFRNFRRRTYPVLFKKKWCHGPSFRIFFLFLAQLCPGTASSAAALWSSGIRDVGVFLTGERVPRSVGRVVLQAANFYYLPDQTPFPIHSSERVCDRRTSCTHSSSGTFYPTLHSRKRSRSQLKLSISVWPGLGSANGDWQSQGCCGNREEEREAQQYTHR